MIYLYARPLWQVNQVCNKMLQNTKTAAIFISRDEYHIKPLAAKIVTSIHWIPEHLFKWKFDFLGCSYLLKSKEIFKPLTIHNVTKIRKFKYIVFPFTLFNIKIINKSYKNYKKNQQIIALRIIQQTPA